MKAYISKDANLQIIDYLKQNNFQVNFVSSDHVYKEVASHPDIYMCQLGNSLFIGDVTKLGFSYPDNIIYNGASTGKYFIHNLNHTSPILLEYVIESGLSLIDVKQGYAKCNIVVVNENSIITSDVGIARNCENFLNVLLIESGSIVLDGFSHGFIGGTSGKFGNTILFNGNLSAHPSFMSIKEFIESKGLTCKWFDDYPLTDIGSILFDFGGKI